MITKREELAWRVALEQAMNWDETNPIPGGYNTSRTKRVVDSMNQRRAEVRERPARAISGYGWGGLIIVVLGLGTALGALLDYLGVWPF